MFGCFGFIASLISLLLIETLNKKLDDTIREAEGDENYTRDGGDDEAVRLTNVPAVEMK